MQNEEGNFKISRDRCQPAISIKTSSGVPVPTAIVYLMSFQKDIAAKVGRSGPASCYKGTILSQDGTIECDIIFWSPPKLRQNITIGKVYSVYNGRFKYSEFTISVSFITI
jgi:hypothetical protein